MSEFDRRHNINQRRKDVFLLLMLLCLIAAAPTSWALMPEFQTDNRISAAISGALYISAALFGFAAAFLLICYKILALINRPHAVAALRSLFLDKGF